MKQTGNVLEQVEKRLGTTNVRLLFILIVMVIGLGLLEGDKLFAAAGLRSMASSCRNWDFLHSP